MQTIFALSLVWSLNIFQNVASPPRARYNSFILAVFWSAQSLWFFIPTSERSVEKNLRKMRVYTNAASLALPKEKLVKTVQTDWILNNEKKHTTTINNWITNNKRNVRRSINNIISGITATKYIMLWSEKKLSQFINKREGRSSTKANAWTEMIPSMK